MLAGDRRDEEQADDLVLAEEARLERARELRETRGERVFAATVCGATAILARG